MERNRDDHEFTAAPRGLPHVVDFLWLSFLALYLTPWITTAPLTSNWIASAIGTACFLLIFFHSYRVAPERLLPHVLLTAGIGFALAWFGGVWNVFNVLAASIAARLQPRRTALIVIALLQVALVVFGLSTRIIAVAWASGVYFGILAAGTTMLLADLDRRNRELRSAQGKIRSLTVVAERERIAQDLHDLLGRGLTAIALKADLARRLAKRDPERSAQEMSEVAKTARESLGEIRAAVTGIAGRTMPDELDRARAMLTTAGITTTISAEDVAMDAKHELVAAMVLREAVTNIVRHSQADNCSISWKSSGDGAELVVTDNGCGGACEGFGTNGMRRRVAAVDGALSISGGTTGTTVSASLPKAL